MVEILSCRMFETRKQGWAVIVELRVIASNGQSEHGPTPAHVEGSEASLFIQITGREPQIYQREVKSLILAALGVDTRDEAGKARLAAWDAADAWTKPIGSKPCLTEQCLPDDGSTSALAGRVMAVWGRPKQSGEGKWFTNHFYEVWNDEREKRDGLPVFDAAKPPEAPPKAPF